MFCDIKVVFFVCIFVYIKKKLYLCGNFATTLIINMKKNLLILAVAALIASCANKPADMNNDATIETILTRVSVRQFTADKPSDEQIETLLRCAMAAPSAVNKQPWAFVVVDDRATLDTIGARMPNTRISENVQVAFVMCGDLTKALDGVAQDFWIHDVSAATENLLLAAHSMGLGAVWCGVYPNPDRVAMTQEILHLPSHIIPLCVVPVGTPAEQPAVKDKWNTDNIHHNQW